MSKKYLYILISILVVAILAMLTYETSTSVKFEPDKSGLMHDFGNLRRNEIEHKKFVFNYINTKYDKLNIYGVIDGCNCTTSTVSPGTYHLNDTVRITTQYDPFKYRDSGRVEKQIFLITNKQVSVLDTLYPLILKGTVFSLFIF